MRTLLWVVLLAITTAAADEPWRDGKITEVAISNPLSVATSSSVNKINIVQKLVDKRVFVPYGIV